MKYIRPTPNPSGAYPAPQSTPASGLVLIPEELAAQLLACNGFAALTIEDGQVTAVAPNTEAWEAWKASQPAQSDPMPTAQNDTDAMLVDHEYRLTLLELGLTE